MPFSFVLAAFELTVYWKRGSFNLTTYVVVLLTYNSWYNSVNFMILANDSGSVPASSSQLHLQAKVSLSESSQHSYQ